MNFKINIETTKSYYDEAYSEIISLNKIKKYEPVFSILLFVFGILLFVLDENKILGYFSLLFCLFGVFEFVKSITAKQRWIKARLESKIVNKNLFLEFTDQFLIHEGPFSKGQINWNGIQQIIKSNKGIIVKPANGVIIYLPDSRFDSLDQINFILSKSTKSN